MAPLKTQCDCIDPVLLWAAQAVLALLESSWPHRSPLLIFELCITFSCCDVIPGSAAGPGCCGT